MAETRRCPQCGTELAEDVAQGLCPKCLMRAAFGPTAAEAAQTQASPASHAETSGAVPGQPASMPREGQTFGSYRLVRMIGRGGMGTVYEAEHVESGRRVALKILSQSLDSPETRARFLREGRLAASINHPNSVYIYGTEEIEGTPAIAMELVPGGTLEDRIKQNGPMRPAEAVDTMLQIIEGLEAAQAVGVLHRDVKPSNCFIESDGTVKVGDFGLSISTKGRVETIVTMTGAFLGTPAFSSPEQLKGEELDVRSDIYAVGITLYYLLTGQTPFKADNLVRFVAMALERPAELPATIQRHLPKGLGGVVLRCLEKQPARRFRNYAQLREALLPYASAAPTPATLGWRAVAYIIDMALWMAVTSPLGLIVMSRVFLPTDSGGHRSAIFTLATLGTMPLWMLYFAVAEGFWGASVGKAVCRLRVIGPGRSVPGLPRALLRAFIFVIVPVLPSWIYLRFNPDRVFTMGADWIGIAVGYSHFVLLALLFLISARRRNGFAGLHDLASGLRVIRKPARETRPLLEAEEPPQSVSQATAKVGPYHILSRIEKIEGQELLLGYDARLLRKVTIRLLPDGAPPVPAAIRKLGRSARLRWLSGRRAPGENWDAYEAVIGRPLVALVIRPQPWRFVRYWLLDLADELAAGLKDGTIPSVLDLDRVWITAEGRAKLLDFPAPGASGDIPKAAKSPSARPDFESARAFLNQVAVAALEGRIVDVDAARGRAPSVPLPLHARAFFHTLPVSQSMEALVGGLTPLMQKVACASRVRRLGLVLACALLPILMVGGMLIGRHFMRLLTERQPDLIPLQVSLSKLAAIERQQRDNRTARQIQALEIYIAGRFGKTISDPATWTTPLAAGISEDLRAKARQAVAAHPSVSKEELAAATAVAEQLVGAVDMPNTLAAKSFLPMVALMSGMVTMMLGLASIACAVIFRSGLAMLIFGVVAVRRDGSRASRLRCLGRALITWSPCALGLVAMLVALSGLSQGPGDTALVVCASALALFASLAVVSALLPDRTIQDRLAGTWLVTR